MAPAGGTQACCSGRAPPADPEFTGLPDEDVLIGATEAGLCGAGFSRTSRFRHRAGT